MVEEALSHRQAKSAVDTNLSFQAGQRTQYVGSLTTQRWAPLLWAMPPSTLSVN